MLSKKTRVGIVIVFIILFVLAGVVSCWTKNNLKRGRFQDFFTAVYLMGALKLHYYQPVSLNQLIQAYWKTGTISGMLKSLNDPYTRYLGEKEFAELKKETKGTFGGIGVYLIPKEEELLISSVVKDSPGEKAGLQQGDRIIGIEGHSVKKLGTEVAIAKIRGLAGTKVSLRIKRGENQKQREFEILITRADIFIPTVDLKIKEDPVIGKYAHLKIYQFAETTPIDLEKTLVESKKASCNALVLDLRSNPGGSLDAALKVSSIFLPENVPIIHILRQGVPVETVKTQKVSVTERELPMILLVDAWSASASEIVSGALKDQKRATLVGTRTFGKDLIQEVRELPNRAGVTITIASYLTSGEVNIHKRGVKPDKIVEIPGALDKLLKNGDPELFFKMQKLQEDEALRILRAMLQTERKLVS